ncbi:MAG: HNH endonuclease [Anaerolineae bacterium]|jgi:hypothetical protein|nr:HNH endonuclease [Anaerolineae bacterium]MBT3714264.1 HNH endonuclease [Anaerolineae bacterium]MBT4311191.1 HNH endonuclease [Anaerolineae bacterium]MBT4458412.1 HNH endonuclease [Anaerolineae bacterium]MBT4843764.1 HNH endonuclease [Anaerolineae bacterium]
MNWVKIYTDVEDKLFPHYKGDVWERGMYYYLLSQTRIRGLDSATIPLPQISVALQCSDFKSRKTIRSLAEKGCIELEQTRQGHSVKVLLPYELKISEETPAENLVDIETVDFYKNRDYLIALLKREQEQCFYCLCDISEASCELDHVISQLNGGGNGYRNIVASCHQCNRKKQGGSAENHIRLLRRKHLLNEKEFEARMRALEALDDGLLKPSI